MEKILETPFAGWSHMKLSMTDANGNASDITPPLSYLDDVPFDLIEGFVHAIENNNKEFIKTFDGEGLTWKLIADTYAVYVMIEANAPKLYINDKLDIFSLCEQLIKDIEDDFDAWVDWTPEDISDEKRNERADQLRKELKYLKNISRNPYQHIELGNLLFGNSRGNVPIDRNAFESVFQPFLKENGFDSYGHVERTLKKKHGRFIKDNGHQIFFENETFTLRPYYWGDDEETRKLPNFVCDTLSPLKQIMF